MSRIADFHCHILPGIDDGSKDVEQSIAMLRMEAEQGISHVVATPHFYPAHNNPQRFLRARAESYARLSKAMEAERDLPGLTIGAEVHYFPGMSESEILHDMTVGESSYVLVEMPMTRWTDRMYRELEAVHTKQGLTPIIAHVDRYLTALRDFGIPKTLEQLPVLVQANAEFFTEWMTQGKALRMLRRQQIHLLGSDCHDLSHRPPNLGEASRIIRSRGAEELLQRIQKCQNEVLGIAE